MSDTLDANVTDTASPDIGANSSPAPASPAQNPLIDTPAHSPVSTNQDAFLAALNGTAIPPKSTIADENTKTKLKEAFDKEQKRRNDDMFIFDPTVRDKKPLSQSIEELLATILGAFGYGSYAHTHDPEWRKLINEVLDPKSYIDPNDPGYKPPTFESASYSGSVDTYSRPPSQGAGLGKFSSAYEAAASLLEIIKQHESSGNANIVNDYRTRMNNPPGSGPFTGFLPGSTTPGGLKVPVFTELPLKEVIAWQKQYLGEQEKQGLPGDKRSSAVGHYQFVSKTLEGLARNHNIDLNSKFTPELQRNLAIMNMIDTIENHKSLPVDKLIEKMEKQWVALYGKDISAHISALREASISGELEKIRPTAPQI